MSTELQEVEIVSLQPLQELRFIMRDDNVATVELTDGMATVFGWSIQLHVPIVFRSQPFSVSTSSGCALKIYGTFVSYYTAPYEEFSLTHEICGAINNAHSPIVFVVGAPSVGKTSLCKLLCNTILTNCPGHTPVYVNADPEHAPFCPQGCIGAIPVSMPINNYGFPFIDPLIYTYGSTKVEESRSKLYIEQFKELITHIQARRKVSGLGDGGVIIDFPSVTNTHILEQLKTIIKFVDDNKYTPFNIVVLGDDRLYLILRRFMAQAAIFKFPMMPGAVSLSKETRTLLRSNETKRYFYGDGIPDLQSTTYLLAKSKDTLIYSLGNLNILENTILPNQNILPDPTKAFPVQLSQRHIGIILALVPKENRDDLWKQAVIGFLHVLEIDEQNNQITVLKPNPDPLPTNTIIASQIKWNPKS